MPSRQNVEALDSIKGKIEKATALYFTDYMGLSVDEMNILRSNLHAAEIEYRVLKNTILSIAVKESGYEGLDEVLKGPTAVAFGYTDPTAPARVFKNFLKNEGKVKERPAVKGLVFEGEVMDAAYFVKLADLPPKEELLAMLLSGLQSPLQMTLSVLQAPMRNLVGLLSAVKETKN